MYIVMYYESYVGNHFDENTKVFTDKIKADNYALQLNTKLAAFNCCSIIELDGYYTVEWVPFGKE